MAGENFVPHQGNCVLVINPGSTSTKFGVFSAEGAEWASSVHHGDEEIEQFRGRSMLARTGYRASRGKQSERWVLILICAFAAWLVFQNANDKGLRTLYPIGPDGNPITTQPGTVASLGIAIYVAGAGIAAAFMGALTFFQSAGKEVADGC